MYVAEADRQPDGFAGQRSALRGRLVGAALPHLIRAAESLRGLLDAGIAERALRADINSSDVLLSLGGIALIAGGPQQHAQARRLIALLIDGLAFGADQT